MSTPDMRGAFFHRRVMAYTALVGLLYLTYGVVQNGVDAAAIGPLAIAFAGIIAAYKCTATYDDHSARAGKNAK